MIVMEGMDRRHAEWLKDHRDWLESLTLALDRVTQGLQGQQKVLEQMEAGWRGHAEWLHAHEEAVQAHQDWLRVHDRAMVEIDRKLDNLIEAINRFVQGRDGH
jgi:uncharacterized protein YukE